MASKDVSFKSKQQIKCDHCKVAMRRDRLMEHTRTFHPGLPKREEGGVKSGDLLVMFGKEKRMESQDIEEDSTNKRQRVNVESEATNADVLASVSLAPNIQGGSDMNRKLDAIIAQLAKLNSPVSEKLPTSLSTEAEELSAMQVLVKGSKSIQRICEVAGFIADCDRDQLICNYCCSDESSRTGPGIFHYDFTLGLDFTITNQPAKFFNLKKSIVRHLSNVTHRKNLLKDKENTEQKRREKAKQKSIGMTVGKQSYALLKCCRPFADFEMNLMLLSDASVKIGNLNHSRKFPSNLRPAFAQVLDNRLKRFLQQPMKATNNIPPVGFIADKVTTRRRTGQMFALVVFTPGMPHLLSPVSLGITSVTKHDGDSIANDVADACKKYEIRDQIAGFGFDGQYFHLGVPEKVRIKMQLSENVNFEWDAAHLFQLADKDMRKSAVWIDEICKDIAAVLHKFSFGKLFESAVDMAEHWGVSLRAPTWFSETRFAPYAYTVFRNFLSNYCVIRRVLEDIASSNDKQAADADNLLRRIRTLEFVVKTIICADLYRAMGEVSCKLQKVYVPFWTKIVTIDKFATTLNEMAEGSQEHFPCLNQNISDLQKCMFHDLPLLVSDVGVMTPLRETRLRSRAALPDEDETAEEDHLHHPMIRAAYEHGKLASAKMLKSLGDRFMQAYRDYVHEKGSSASLLPILMAANVAINEDAFLLSHEVIRLKSKHPHQIEAVSNLCLNMFRHRLMLVNCTTDIQVYHLVFTEPSLFTGSEPVLNTLASTVCSFPPESVVESMGNIVEEIRSVRGGSKSSTNRRDVEDISDELIIHWNGPAIHHSGPVVTEALNLHFGGCEWHFTTQDVRSKMYKISKVVDRINGTKALLPFMAD